jgi:glucose-6-phosphate-specific signal transduction histidine kinase
MQRRIPLSRQEMQLVLLIEKEESENLPKLEPAIRREVAQLLRALIGECVAAVTTQEHGEDE